MSEMEQFQVVVSEIQATRQQMASLNAQILELKATSDAVSNQPKDLALTPTTRWSFNRSS